MKSECRFNRPGSATGRTTQDFMKHENSTAERTPGSLQRSPHMPPDEYDECGEHQPCGRCGGDGVIHLSEAGPSIWGEDCFCEGDRLIQCPTCRGGGVEHANS